MIWQVRVFPPEVVDNPMPDFSPSVSACAVTRAQSQQFGDVLNLSDSFLCPVNEPAKKLSGNWERLG